MVAYPMSGASAAWPLLYSYGAYALALALGFYGSIRFFGGHLSKMAEDNLSLWLMGAYESTWASHFCNLFDRVFSERHLSLKCFLRSAIASMIAVVFIWVLVDPILGLIKQRAVGSLDLWQVLLIGAAINVIPDYLSLLETRWLLHHFRAVRSLWGQLLILIADALFTGLIIWIAITGFIWVRGIEPLSIVEMLALFSVYSIFYYSTFLTSVWAWVYCLSTWFMRLFSRTFLGSILNIEAKPSDQVALVGGLLVAGVTVMLAPLVEGESDTHVSPIDRKLCAWFPDDACPHVVRVSQDEELSLAYFIRNCGGSVSRACLEKIRKFSRGDLQKSAGLFQRNCDYGNAEACTNLGWMFKKGHGVAEDADRAVALFRQACDDGHARGCIALGGIFVGRGVDRDDEKAVSLYRQACDDGHARGCTALGLMFADGRGVDRDDEKAVSLYREACADGDAVACTNLGWMFKKGHGVAEDADRAVALFRQACDDGHEHGCTNLRAINRGRVPTLEEIYYDVRDVSLYREACDGDHARGCRLLEKAEVKRR